MVYQPRTYRNFAPGATKAFQVGYKESDLFCRATSDLSTVASEALMECRIRLDAYVAARPGFAEVMTPLPDDPMAPLIVREMIAAARLTGVGPMAAVAGAVADAVGRALAEHSSVAIVENGGDCFLALDRPLVVPIHGAGSMLSDKVGVVINPDRCPCGLCTSSGTQGHSFSLGKADAVAVLGETAVLADAVATAAANKINDPSDCGDAVAWAADLPGILGAVAIAGETLAAAGDIELGQPK